MKGSPVWRLAATLVLFLACMAPPAAAHPIDSASLTLTPVLADYAALGVEHIVTGFDHLFFVIALTFLVRARGRLIATITAFTLAHSLTLASTALGLLDVPKAPVEALIALSIVLVCAECLHSVGSNSVGSHSVGSEGEVSLTRRAPWLVAFAFGLLHGFGFASALLEIGLPERHLPSALFSFNLGVEAGQLLVIAILLSLGSLCRFGPMEARLGKVRIWARRGIVYAMGGVAAFWSIERTLAALSG